MFYNRVATQVFPTEVVSAAKTLTAAESGKTLYLALAGGFTVTLPAMAAGLKFTFVAQVAPTTAYIVAAATADADKIVGHVIASTGGDEDSEQTAGGDQVNFVASTAVIGDRVELECDGTYWYVSARCDAAGAITITG